MPYYVEQVEGVSNVTPWGQLTRLNIRFPVTDPDQVKYFQTNSRYVVADIDVENRRAAERAKLRSRSEVRRGRSGPNKGGTPLTEERIIALAKHPIKQTDSKVKLLALANDLGVSAVIDKDTRNAELVKLIKAKQEEILAAVAKGSEPDGEADGDADGTEPEGEGDDDGEANEG